LVEDRQATLSMPLVVGEPLSTDHEVAGLVEVTIVPPSPAAQQLVVEEHVTPRNVLPVGDGPAAAQVAPLLLLDRITPESPTARQRVDDGHVTSRMV
jgi:hypothetical protein